MIRIDRKVARAALDLTDSYSTVLVYDPARGLFIMNTDRTIVPKVPADDIPDAVERLIEAGFFCNYARCMGGIKMFRITPKLRHRFAFALDSFSKKFFGGFVTGVATTVAANLLSPHVRALLLSAVRQLSGLLSIPAVPH